jgi:hypothetical protein
VQSIQTAPKEVMPNVSAFKRQSSWQEVFDRCPPRGATADVPPSLINVASL